MPYINDLVQGFWRTSSDVGASFFAMRRLLEISQCFDFLEVSFDIISAFSTAIDLADKNLQRWLFQPSRTLFGSHDQSINVWLVCLAITQIMSMTNRL